MKQSISLDLQVSKGYNFDNLRRNRLRTSLVAQRSRIHPSIQETWVRSLIQEDPTCLRALSPCATTREPGSCNYWAHKLHLHGSAWEATAVRGPHTTREQPLLLATREKSLQQSRPSTALKGWMNKQINKKKKNFFLRIDFPM